MTTGEWTQGLISWPQQPAFALTYALLLVMCVLMHPAGKETVAALAKAAAAAGCTLGQLLFGDMWSCSGKGKGEGKGGSGAQPAVPRAEDVVVPWTLAGARLEAEELMAERVTAQVRGEGTEAKTSSKARKRPRPAAEFAPGEHFAGYGTVRYRFCNVAAVDSTVNGQRSGVKGGVGLQRRLQVAWKPWKGTGS